MAARGVSFNHVGHPESSISKVLVSGLSGANAVDLLNENISICGWMRIKGNQGDAGPRGNTVFSFFTDNSQLNDDLEWQSSNSAFGSSPFNMWGQHSQNFTQTFVSGTGNIVATNEDWFYALSYASSTGVITYMVGKDGATSLSTFNSGAIVWDGTSILTIFMIGATCVDVNRGNNTEHLNYKIWKRIFTPTEMLAEMKSVNPVISTGLWAHYKLESSTDLTDYSGNSRTLESKGTPGNGTMDPVDLQTPAAGGGVVWRGLSIRH